MDGGLSADFGCTLHAVTPHEPLATFRGELRRHREEAGLNYTQAAKRAGVSPAWWSNVERGWEAKRGDVRSEVAPSRSTLIKMARAVGWSAAEALSAAGMSPLTAAESRGAATDPRRELQRVSRCLSDGRVWLLVSVAEAMVDSAIPIEVPLRPDPRTRTVGYVIEGPGSGEPEQLVGDDDGGRGS